MKWTARMASMGPRSVERGNLGAGTIARLRGQASMGPRSVERGNVAISKGKSDGDRASMGPRSVERGNAMMRQRAAGSLESFNGAAFG